VGFAFYATTESSDTHEGVTMGERQEQAKRGPTKISLDTFSFETFSLDTWAVIFALLLAVLVWLGALKHIPW
jgi:hypothetical protein